MRQGARVLQSIHKQLDVTNVEDTVEDIREQMEITQQIANAISDPVNVGLEGLDEVCELPGFGRSVHTLLMFPHSVQEELEAELASLEQDVLDERLSGADQVPVQSPVSRVAASESFSLLGPSPVSQIPSARESRNSGRRRRRTTTTTTSLPCDVDPYANYALLWSCRAPQAALPKLPSSSYLPRFTQSSLLVARYCYRCYSHSHLMFKLEYSQTQNTADVACKAQTVQYRQEVQQGFVRRVRDPSFYRDSISCGAFNKRANRGRKCGVSEDERHERRRSYQG